MKCPTCGQICRNNREICALCGTPLKEKRRHGGLVAVIVILLLILAGVLGYLYLPWQQLPFLNRGQSAELVVENEPSPAEGEQSLPAAEPEQIPEPQPASEGAEPPARELEHAEPYLFEDAVEIWAMPTYTLALCRDGTVKLAGQSASPEFGFDLFDWENIVQVLPADYFVAGLTADGRVRLTGEVSGFEEAARWTDVARLYYDAGNLLGLTADGRVLAAGAKLSFDPSELTDIVDIIPAQLDTLAVTGDGEIRVLRTTRALWDAEGMTELAQVALGSDFALFLMTDGSVRTSSSLWSILNAKGWKDPYYGWDNMRQLLVVDHFVAGLTRDGQVICETHIPWETCPDTSEWTDVARLVGEQNHAFLFALTGDGRVLASPEDAAQAVASWENVQDLQVNDHWMAALTGDGQVLIWSWDESCPAPDTSSWTHVSAISLGREHLAALREDGGVLAAGDNSFGQCGPAV